MDCPIGCYALDCGNAWEGRCWAMDDMPYNTRQFPCGRSTDYEKAMISAVSYTWDLYFNRNHRRKNRQSLAQATINASKYYEVDLEDLRKEINYKPAKQHREEYMGMLSRTMFVGTKKETEDKRKQLQYYINKYPNYKCV